MSKELQDFEMSDELLISVFKYVSLYDLSDCKFELGFDDGCKWCNAELNGRVIDCIQYDGNIFHMMNNDGSFSPLNQMKSAYDAMQQSQHPVQAETVSAEEVKERIRKYIMKTHDCSLTNAQITTEFIMQVFSQQTSQSTPPQPQHGYSLQQVGDGWISVEDSPLYKKDANNFWECTENGNGAFLAAVPYNDHKRPNERNLWWIKPCVVEDINGLCVIGDDENEPAGWKLEDVTHYKKLDFTPPHNQLINQ